ncbi:MAG: DEAD/DEAH box helicase [Parachlamydiaceae bacterium]|nr:DEAD/DEAH box helicase [Parachlamydiaceae bacterium]
MQDFTDLDLDPSILDAIREAGYTTPTPIQSQAIPKILAGIDLLASAQTGTGKTGAFLLPLLHMLLKPSKLKGYGPRALILVPTRELAMQVAAEAKKYSVNLPRMRTVCIYGGAPYPIQNRELSRPYEILVATPGRLIDHLERGRIDFSRLEMLILDEADRMLDMGFIEPVEQIAAATPKERQTLLFSATLKGEVLRLSKQLLNKPEEITVAHSHDKHENIEQRLHYVDNISHKHRLLDHLLNDPTINQVIVFTSTKIAADELVDTLYEQGHNAAALHGDMNQGQRTRTIGRMRRGDIRILIATDVAARGIDVQTITHVINFDLPNCAEDYVHRIGRTGRAGCKGVALSFAGGRDIQLVRRIEQFTGQKLEATQIEGLEPKLRPTAGHANGAPPRGRRPSPGYSGGSNSSFRGRPSSSGSRSEGGRSEGGGYGSRSEGSPRSEGSSYGGRSEGSSNSGPARSSYSNNSEGSFASRGNSASGSGKPSYSNAAKPSYGNSRPSYGNSSKPSYGNSSGSGYGASKGSYGSSSGEPKRGNFKSKFSRPSSER